MKRLLGLLGLTCLVVLTACFYLGNTVTLLFGAGAVVLFVVSMLIPAVRKEKTLPVGFITSAFVVLLFVGYGRFYVEPIKVYDEKTCDIVAVQKDEVYYNNGYYHYELDIKEIDGKKVNSGILLRSRFHTYSNAYDELRFKTELYFTENGSLKAKRLFFEAYLFDEGGVEVVRPEKRPLRYHFIALRDKLANALYRDMDYDTAAFSASVLLGDKYAMEPETKSLLRETGLSHISVVSGLHLSIVALISRKIFTGIFKRRVISGSLTILIIVLFAAVCGFSPSVIRAGVMLIICIIGTMIYRKSDSLNSLGAAALLLTVFNPYSVGDIGMLLSFASTIGIVLWSSKISKPIICRIEKFTFFKIKYVSKIIRVIIDTFAMSLCASIWTLPIIVFVYSGISTVSLIANVLIVPFVGIVLILIALCIITHFIGFLEVMCNMLAHLVSAFYN
ncbi:MAG: ComEC/Rec2 family competence protein, partial [Ruminococcus sp.]|nr:ComEC/Rec2 family competence protein [Ruminococcus sp.]